MRISITFKVFATLLIASSIVVAGMYLFMQWSFQQGFIHFVEARKQQHIESLSQRLAEEYQDAQGWEHFRNNRRHWIRLLRERPLRHPANPSTDIEEMDDPPPVGRQAIPPQTRQHAPRPSRLPRMALLDVDQSVIVGRLRDTNGLELHPIILNDETIGYLGMTPGPLAKELAEIRFEQQHTQSLVYIALGMLLLSVVMGLPLAYTLVRPLRRIADASKQLALGFYATRLPVTSSDEIGQLAQDINDLAQALQKTEQSRRQWVADISHELRTPLSVLRGEVEALQDDMRPLSKEALDSLHGEIMQLGRLVDELYQLSLSDVGALSYHKENIDAATLLEEDMGSLESDFRQKEISLEMQNRLPAVIFVHVDAERLSQLFRNLLMNSLNYTDPGGRVEVGIDVNEGMLIFDFQDTEPGVPEDALPQLFERLYRVDRSRSRATGGAGLGLAICRNIVEAHEGRISAHHSPLGGLRILVELPVAP